MNKKFTITLPEELIDELEERIEHGGRSKFIAEAIQKKLLEERFFSSKTDPIDDFLSFNQSKKTYSQSKLSKIISNLE
ncbi:MAG TPA: ribbon-helix-helix domain-containing protein [Candidatus Dojkabacteria bacterium]|jgi:metal-responsive CopG/Arc/MetJ family transcriptional regulator